MKLDLTNLDGRFPLEDYPWKTEVDRIIGWAEGQAPSVMAFCFDLVMSLAYIDATAGLEKYIETCSSLSPPYNAHLGFINLCSPCFETKGCWQYQKAAKPQSGALGKLSSEVVLRFIAKSAKNFEKIIAIGGVEFADAVLLHKTEGVILAEVKSAPLITYPVIFLVQDKQIQNHEKFLLTSSQLKQAQSALYLHNQNVMPLGAVGGDLWPFKPAADFLTDQKNEVFVRAALKTWEVARSAYISKNKDEHLYYLANASGSPPKIAKERDSWPSSESISDSKTSAGMDRTDDIKKGIYQVLKIGTHYKTDSLLKTAIISNLPAYRHGDDYIKPFIDMMWGIESDIENFGAVEAIRRSNLKRVFDYIITLEDPVLRGMTL